MSVRAVCADRDLRQKLIASSQELAKNQQYFPFLMSKKQTIVLPPNIQQPVVSYTQ